MRITREALIRIANDTVERFLRKDRSIAAAYMCGSLLGSDFQLGGAADIDLVFIHANKPSAAREIIPLTEEIHLDIAHHAQDEYRYGKQLRVHPWLGPTLNTALALHDPRHILDFVQASVRGQFDREDYIFERAQNRLAQSRKIWSSYQPFGGHPEIGDSVQFVRSYVRALGHAVNAIASLSGPPLAERRLLLEFQSRAEAVGKPGLYPGVLGLLGMSQINQTDLPALIERWEEIYRLLPESNIPVQVHPSRKTYYMGAFQTMQAQQKPEAMLYPMLRTIALILTSQPGDMRVLEKGQAFFGLLGLGEQVLHERLAALDAYLDSVEETIENWAQENGVLQG